MARGAEGTHITEMIRAFEALGHSVTVVSPGAGARSAGGEALLEQQNLLR